MIEPTYVAHEFDNVDRNAARCPRHPDQILFAESEWCGDILMRCPRFDYRAVMRAPLVEGCQPRWDAPKGPAIPGWTPPVRQQ